jgi:hypothetical protein
MRAFARILDEAVASLASDYRWYRGAGTVCEPIVRPLGRGTFAEWIRVHRNNDPQTKVPKVRNDRAMIEELSLLDDGEEVCLAAA